MESIHVSELRARLVDFKEGILESVNAIIEAMDTKILVGNIHMPVEKKPRKKRTRKVKVAEFPPPKVEAPLPDADEGNTFYGKKKREKKIAEVE